MSTVKVKRLLKAFANESVKRLPYIFLVLIVLSLIQFVRLSNQTAQGVRIAQANSLDSKTLLKRVTSLAEDNKRLSLQNKQLTEQNIDIANQNSQHLDCLADLFARYTRDSSPILKADLTTCMVITLDTSKTPSTPGGTSTPTGSIDQSAPVASSNQPTANNTTTQPDNSQPAVPAPRKGIVRGIIDFINPF